MESVTAIDNDHRIQKTILTPGTGGQPTFTDGTRVSRSRKIIDLNGEEELLLLFYLHPDHTCIELYSDV